jgi:carboxyl-terminal processing protease
METLSTASHPLPCMGRRSHGLARACPVFFNLLPLLALCFAPEAFSQGAKDGPLPEAPLKVIPERVPAKPETTPKSESKSEPAAKAAEAAPKADPTAGLPVDPTAYEQLSVFARALQLVKQDFVDETKVGYRELVQSALRGVLSSLDPHCQFLDAKEYKSVQEDTRGRFSGVGLVVSHKDGKLVVVTPMEGGPGLRAGILSGDVILKVDDKLTEKFGANEVANLLRGDTGKAVKLTLYRPQTKETLEIEVVREAIQVATIRDAKILATQDPVGTKVGYVRISQFSVPTAAELSKALDELEKQGMQALVLDLRHNPGGVLESAVDVAGEFLPAESLVVSTEGRLPSQRREYRTQAGSKQRPAYPLAVLVNHGSASAAEIVAGALRDLKRAIIVGETTFGKGSVQSVVPLQDGSAIRLTTAKYYTPGKMVIHERGVEPTIRSVMSPEQDRLLSLQRREDSLSEREIRELSDFKDPQMERAVDTLRAVVIYAAKAQQPESRPPQAK